MLRHFPFGDAFDAGMGGRVLRAGEPLIDVDEARYAEDLALKRAQLEGAPVEYFHAPAGSLGAQWEIARLLLSDLATQHPTHFELVSDGARATFHNRLLGEQQAFVWDEPASLPLAPLDWVGRQVQEDLVLVAADERGSFVGGQLCFPNGWDIADRLGHAFLDMHTPTPGSTLPGVRAGGRLLLSLLPGKVFCRLGWNLKLTAQLDLSTKYRGLYRDELTARAPQLSPEQAGREVHVRIERQTFSRLTSAPYILFGIHTYVSPIAEEARDPERARRLLAVLGSAPEDVRQYKNIGLLEHALFPYLEQRARAPAAI